MNHTICMKIYSLLIIFSLFLFGGNSQVFSREPKAEPRRQVLMLYSFSRWTNWQKQIVKGFDAGLEEAGGQLQPIIYEENLDSARLIDGQDDEVLIAYLEDKYAGIPFDMLIAEGQAAGEFLFRNPSFFPKVSRYALNFLKFPQLPAGRGDEFTFETIVTPDIFIGKIKELLPNVNRVIAVVDNSPMGKNAEQSFRNVNDTGRALPFIEIWNNFTASELYERASKLPNNSILLYTPLITDRKGELLDSAQIATTLAKNASVPVFTPFDSLIGIGPLGGLVSSGYEQGKIIARLALFGAAGLPPSQAAYEEEISHYLFDAAALKRWKIKIPANFGKYQLVNVRISFFKRHWLASSISIFLISLFGVLSFLLWRASKVRSVFLKQLKYEQKLLEQRVEERTKALSHINKELTREIADRRQAEAQAYKLVEEKTTLHKELQHRVKNSISLISSLINLESHNTQNTEVSQILHKLESRVSSLAYLYEVLFHAGELEMVEMASYLGIIVDTVGDSLGADVQGIVIKKNFEPFSMSVKQSLSLGLMVNELITDSIRHAFIGRESGTIEISGRQRDARFILEIKDDGIGLPEGFNLKKSKGFGLLLVDLLCQQLNGNISLGKAMRASAKRGPGARFLLSIPVE